MLKSIISLFALAIGLTSLAQNEIGLSNDLKKSIKNEATYKSSLDLTKIQGELIQKRLNLTLEYNQRREDYSSRLAYGLKEIKSLEKSKRRALDSLSILKSPFALEYEKNKQLYLNYDTLTKSVEKFNAFLEENKVLNDLISFKSFCGTQYYTNLVDCYLSQGGAIAFLVSEPNKIKKLSKILEENSQNERIIFLYEDTKNKEKAFYVINIDTLNQLNFKITSFYYTKNGKEFANYKSREQQEDLYRFIKNYNDENQLVYKLHGVPHLKVLDKSSVLKITAKNEVLENKIQLDRYIAEEKRISKYFDEQIQTKNNNMVLFDLEILRNRRISDSLEIAEEITYYTEEFPLFLNVREALKIMSEIEDAFQQELFLKRVLEDFGSDFLMISQERLKLLNEEFDKTFIFECLLQKLNQFSSSKYYQKPVPVYGISYSNGYELPLKLLQTNITEKIVRKHVFGYTSDFEFTKGLNDLSFWVDNSGEIQSVKSKLFEIRFEKIKFERDVMCFKTADKLQVFMRANSDNEDYFRIGNFTLTEGYYNTSKRISESLEVAKKFFEKGDYKTVMDAACNSGMLDCEGWGTAKFSPIWGDIYKRFWRDYPIEIVDELEELYDKARYNYEMGITSNSGKSSKSFCLEIYNGDKYEIKLLGEDGGKVVYNLHKQGALVKTVTGSWDEKFVGFGDATKIVISLDGLNQGMEFLLRKYSNGAWQDLQEMEGMQRTWSICLP